MFTHPIFLSSGLRFRKGVDSGDANIFPMAKLSAAWTRLYRRPQSDSSILTEVVSPPLPDAAKKKERIEWVDYAKGICIIWVVALYSTNFVQETTHMVGWMEYVAEFAKPFRMPDFFLLSGLFVARVLNRSWRSYIDSKVLHFVYFYSVWVTLKFVNMHAGDFSSEAPLALLTQYLHWYLCDW